MSGSAPSVAPRGPAKRQLPRPNPQSKIILYALVSLGSFLLALSLIALMIWKAEALTRFGLVGHVYFPIVVVLGLVAAAFLFGVLRSHASYRGRHLGGVLQLGGPAVVFALVVVGGKILVPDTAPFSLAVYVHGPGGNQDIVLANSGFVILDLDQRVPEQIGNLGQAVFPSVPAKFRNQDVPVSVETEAFQVSPESLKLRLVPPLVYLPVVLRSGNLKIHVKDEKNGRPISGADIRVDLDALGTTDVQGDLKAEFHVQNPQQKFTLRVTATGYQPFTAYISPYSINLTEVQLKRER
jgi:hypothetical protein